MWMEVFLVNLKSLCEEGAKSLGGAKNAWNQNLPATTQKVLLCMV